MRWCVYCDETHPGMYRVTFTGAPDGGVPVDTSCLRVFFVALDRMGNGLPHDVSKWNLPLMKTVMKGAA